MHFLMIQKGHLERFMDGIAAEKGRKSTQQQNLANISKQSSMISAFDGSGHSLSLVRIHGRSNCNYCWAKRLQFRAAPGTYIHSH